MRQRNRDAEGGYMLVELLVVISLMAIVGGLLSDAIISAFRSQRDITARATDLNGLRQAMERTTRDMRAASGVCTATSQLLTLEVPTSAGSSLITWSISTLNGASSLIETQTSQEANCAASGTPAMTTVLANLDPATALFGYIAKPGYTPVVPGSVDSYCTVVTSGLTEVRCVGVVGIDLKALLPGHPDIELTDSVQLRNVT